MVVGDLGDVPYGGVKQREWEGRGDRRGEAGDLESGSVCRCRRGQCWDAIQRRRDDGIDGSHGAREWIWGGEVEHGGKGGADGLRIYAVDWRHGPCMQGGAADPVDASHLSERGLERGLGDRGRLSGSCICQRGTKRQPSDEWIHQHDCVWGESRACAAHGSGVVRRVQKRRDALDLRHSRAVSGYRGHGAV